MTTLNQIKKDGYGGVSAENSLARLHLGCGNVTPKGWVNADIQAGPDIDLVADLKLGLPVADASFDCVVSIHALCEMKIWDQVPAMKELHRVLRPGGVLRLALPDFDVNLQAYQARDQNHFDLWNWKSVAGNCITQMLWHNTVHCLYTHEFLEELLTQAGFAKVHHLSFGKTATQWDWITSLDNRPKESLFVEAVK